MSTAGRWRLAPLLLLLPFAAWQAGCAGNKPGLASASPVEREFVQASVTWDLNHDGDVTCEEWRQYAGGLFRDADADRDGFLTKEEFAALARQDRLFETAAFSYFDANSDGRVALAEIVDRPNPAFTLLDINNDCVISPEERRQRGSGRSQHGPPGKAGPGPRR